MKVLLVLVIGYLIGSWVRYAVRLFMDLFKLAESTQATGVTPLTPLQKAKLEYGTAHNALQFSAHGVTTAIAFYKNMETFAAFTAGDSPFRLAFVVADEDVSNAALAWLKAKNSFLEKKTAYEALKASREASIETKKYGGSRK